MSLELLVDVAAGAEPGQPVVGERRPRLREDEDDHARDQQQDRARQRAEQQLGALVGADLRLRGVRAAGESSSSSGTHCVAMILLAALLCCDPVDELLRRRRSARRG